MSSLTSGKMTDLRETQARRLWKLGFGRDQVKAKNFEVYLDQIPQIPEGLLAEDADLAFLSLADPRPGLTHCCRLLGIKYEELGYENEDAVPYDERFATPAGPFWFRHDNGRKNRNRPPDHCREELKGDIQAGTAMDGVFAYAHHPDIVVEGEHFLDLPGTVRRDSRVLCAHLTVWRDQPELILNRASGIAGPVGGTLRVRRK